LEFLIMARKNLGKQSLAILPAEKIFLEIRMLLPLITSKEEIKENL